MHSETKNAIYLLLDILDSMSKSSDDSTKLIKIDQNTLHLIKNDLFNVISQPDRLFENIIEEKKNLIGILPYVLMDKNKFPSNENIVKLAEKSLNISVPNWKNRSRNEIIGIIISNIAEMDNNKDLSSFIYPWKSFISDRNVQLNLNSSDFVDLWLKYFDNYKNNQ